MVAAEHPSRVARPLTPDNGSPSLPLYPITLEEVQRWMMDGHRADRYPLSVLAVLTGFPSRTLRDGPSSAEMFRLAREVDGVMINPTSGAVVFTPQGFERAAVVVGYSEEAQREKERRLAEATEHRVEKDPFIFQEEEVPVLADAFDFLIKNREHIAAGMFVNQMGVKSEDLPRVERMAGGINTTDLKILIERCSTMRQRLTNYVRNKNRFASSNHEDTRFLLKFFNSFLMQTELDEFLEMLFFRYLEHKSGKTPK